MIAGRPSVLQVYVDEPGGGAANVALLREALASDINWTDLKLLPNQVRGAALFRKHVRDLIQRSATDARADIVHSHGTRAATAVAVAQPPAMLVMTMHGAHAIRRARGPNQAVAKLITSKILSRMDQVLCTGRSDLRLVRELRLPSHVHTQWIHSAFSPPAKRDRLAARASLGLHPADRVVLWMGRFEPEKDPAALVEALAEMDEWHRPHALMAGVGTLLKPTMDVVRRKGLSRWVTFPGWCADPADAFSAADAFVSTSRWEGFPLVGLEAASAGLPLVLTDVPGNLDLVEVGLDANLVERGNPSALAASITAALAAEAPDIGRRKALLESFSIKTLRNEVISAYGDLLSGRHN